MILSLGLPMLLNDVHDVGDPVPKLVHPLRRHPVQPGSCEPLLAELHLPLGDHLHRDPLYLHHFRRKPEFQLEGAVRANLDGVSKGVPAQDVCGQDMATQRDVIEFVGTTAGIVVGG